MSTVMATKQKKTKNTQKDKKNVLKQQKTVQIKHVLTSLIEGHLQQRSLSSHVTS